MIPILSVLMFLRLVSALGKKNVFLICRVDVIKYLNNLKNTFVGQR